MMANTLTISTLKNNILTKNYKRELTAIEIAKKDGIISSKTTVNEALKIFKKDLSLSGLAVVDNNIPKGILMRHKLDEALSRHFGAVIFSSRAIELIMDKNPLLVDTDT